MSQAMYEDLNEIATLRFAKELESVSSQTREKVIEMQNEYAAMMNSSGVRSGPQEAAIGRAQIEGSVRLIQALYEIWVDLVKRRNGHISRPDVDFIAMKLEDYAQTQKGHLHKAFSGKRIGAVVNLLTEEAGQRLSAATANARRDLAIMVREHELFSRSSEASEQKTSGAVPANKAGHQPRTIERPVRADQPQVPDPEGNKLKDVSERSVSGTIGKKIWSWVVVSAFVVLALGFWGTFLTSGHPWAADMFFVVGAVIFLAKFLTWEDARQQPGASKKLLFGGITILVLIFTALALRWDHTITQASSATDHAGNDAARPTGSSAPIEVKPEGQSGKVGPPPTGGQISVAERVKIIIASQLQVDASQLKSTDDFEANLGADPASVYFLMSSLELEYNITISASASSKLHTVGETISYIEKQVQEKQERARTTLSKPASSGATQSTVSGATPPKAKTPDLRYILESDFDDEVLKVSGPVLVFFCAESQAACPVMAPTISSVAREHRGTIKVLGIDVYINKALPKAYDAGYFEVPVTILFNGGRERGRITGAASKEAIEHLIENPQAFAKTSARQDPPERKVTNQNPLDAISTVPESDFSDRVLRANVPVLVYFYSSNDASRQVSPLVSQVASEHQGTLRVVKVDSSTESRLANEYHADYFQTPLLILFEDGDARGLIKGTTSATTIQNLLQHPERFAFEDNELPNVSATLESIPDVHESDLEETLKKSELPTLIYFYSDDKDPHCRAVARIIFTNAKSFKGKVNFVKMNTSTARQMSYKYDSWNGPSLVLFSGTKVKDRKSGIISRADITHILDRARFGK
jgi:thioredoxin 1